MRAMIVVAAAIAAAMPVAARDGGEIPEATPDGKPEICIPLSRIRQSHDRSDSVIDFEMMGGKYYRATIAGGCPGLGFEERFGYSTSLNKLCASDIITVLYTSPIPSGARCALGPFQPVKLAAPAKR